MTVTLELTQEQAYTLMEALEFFSRIHMSQFDVITYTLHMDTYEKSLNLPDFDIAEARLFLDQASRVIFPHLSPGAYIGIMQTNERSKISWDIYQQLRHDLTHYTRPDTPLECRGNDFQTPFKVSKQPLPKVIITEDNDEHQTNNERTEKS